jgi:hypothetical protein
MLLARCRNGDDDRTCLQALEKLKSEGKYDEIIYTSPDGKVQPETGK